MDDAIKNLGNWTDEATKQILQNLVDKKRKFDRYRIFHIVLIWLTMAVCLMYLLFLYRIVLFPNSHSFQMMFSAFVRKEGNLFLLLFAIGLFGYMNVIRQKVDKLEEEFHALRCEIIDKSTDLWNTDEAWRNRHLVFRMMKEQYGINLYHENK